METAMSVGRVLISALSLSVVAGCVSAAEIRARDASVCGNYGFHEGTPEFAACLQRENLARQYFYASPSPYYSAYPYY
jgi:hypothetical protein